MDNVLKALHTPVKCISEEDFNDLTLDDVNYSGILFIFDKRYLNLVYDKILKDWMLGKIHRFEQVKTDRMFYVENCDIQTIDSLTMLFSRLYDGDELKKIYIVGDIDEIE